MEHPRIVMMGTGLFAEPTFEALIQHNYPVVGLVTQPDRQIGSLRGSTRQTGKGMKTIALEQQIPVFQPDSINTPEGVVGLRKLEPDLLIVAAYGQILSKEVLGVPGLGGINVHASLLPRYRGAAPIAWAIYQGETRTGVTLIRMTIGLDAGDILAQEPLEIGANETTGEVEVRLATLGASMTLQILEKLNQGPVPGFKQDPALVTRAPKMTKEVGVIDWNRSAEEIRNQIRALQPWPTAFTLWNRPGQEPLRLILYRSKARQRLSSEVGQPGELIISRGELNTLDVFCGKDTVLEVEELQPAGKRRMSAREFLRGRRPLPGDCLGPGSSTVST